MSYKVNIRLVTSDNVLATANVSSAKMSINGFLVMAGRDGKPNWVSEPAMKQGSRGYLKIVEFTDRATKEMISTLILNAYQKALVDRPDSTFGDSAF